MIFETLYDSAQRGELMLVDGGMCHWHLRRDGQLTIREIIVSRPRQGIGTRILAELLAVPGVKVILAKCPADLPSNGWYQARGFVCTDVETTKTGRQVNVWALCPN